MEFIVNKTIEITLSIDRTMLISHVTVIPRAVKTSYQHGHLLVISTVFYDSEAPTPAGEFACEIEKVLRLDLNREWQPHGLVTETHTELMFVLTAVFTQTREKMQINLRALAEEGNVP